MIVIYRWLKVFVLLIALQLGNAQTLSLDTLLVTDIKTRDSLGIRLLHDGFAVKDALLFNSHVSLNLQGVNSLATVLHRGLPSKLFGVNYHGLRLNSITNGTFDINLLPTFYFNNAALNSGGNLSSAIYNSAAGMLDLKQKPGGNSICFGQLYRTYGDFESTILWKLEQKRTSLSIGGNLLNFQNSFDFHKRDTQKKSEVNVSKGYNMLADLRYAFNDRSSLEAGLWIQHNYRDLPEIFHQKGDQRQTDISTRTYANYTAFVDGNIIKLNITYADEELLYKTSIINSLAKTQNLMTTASIKNSNHWQLQIGHKLDKAKANFFTEEKRRNDLFTSLSKKLNYKNIVIDGLLIQHFVDDQFAPIAGEISIRRKDLKVTVIKNFNLPGFNDLYWPIGGNQDLKAEKSWQLTADYAFKINDKILLHTTAYSYRITDFIQWLPTDKGYWAPDNVRKIWSRGLEASLDFESKVGSYTIKNSFQYTLTKSTYEDVQDQKGKQLIYVPLHKMSNTLHVGNKKIKLLINTVFTGKRYEATDNFTSLDPFLIFNTRIKYFLNIRSSQPELGIGIDNISNEDYELVRSFPMPLRRYVFEIKINFNHKKYIHEIN